MRKRKNVLLNRIFIPMIQVYFLIGFGIILLAILLTSCQSPAIVTQQKALCTYSDRRVARFEYRRTEHLNQAVTIYEAEPNRYVVGRSYVIVIPKY
jgi:hypothetical protein